MSYLFISKNSLLFGSKIFLNSATKTKDKKRVQHLLVMHSFYSCVHWTPISVLGSPRNKQCYGKPSMFLFSGGFSSSEEGRCQMRGMYTHTHTCMWMHTHVAQIGLKSKTMKVRDRVTEASFIPSRGIRWGLTHKISLASRYPNNCF